MPEPFRLFAPPPAITEKILLVQSDVLYLALSMSYVQEVLLNVPVVKQDPNSAKSPSIIQFRDMAVPVVLGNKACPPHPTTIVVLFRSEALKTGLMGIACAELPVMASISAEDWLSPVPPLPAPWQSDGKGYRRDNQLYIHAVGLG
jgi:hypothetical protein